MAKKSIFRALAARPKPNAITALSDLELRQLISDLMAELRRRGWRVINGDTLPNGRLRFHRDPPKDED